MKYYFLGAYLPDLYRDDRKLPLNITLFREEWPQMDPADVSDMELVLLRRDVNVVEGLLAERSVAQEHTTRPSEFWSEAMESPEEAPAWVGDFFARKRETGEWTPADAGSLHAAYYDFARERAHSPFLKDYLAFEKKLRNILAAVRSRQLGLNTEDHLLGEGDLVEQLCRSNSEDFGLAEEYPWINDILAAGDPAQRQDVVEKILWDYIEAEVGADPFDFKAILAFLIKLEILENRISQKGETGMKKVRDLEELDS